MNMKIGLNRTKIIFLNGVDMALRIIPTDQTIEIRNEVGMIPNGLEMCKDDNVIIVLGDRLYITYGKNTEPVYERELNEAFHIIVRGAMIFDSEDDYEKYMRKNVFLSLAVIALIALGMLTFFYFAG